MITEALKLGHFVIFSEGVLALLVVMHRANSLGA